MSSTYINSDTHSSLLASLKSDSPQENPWPLFVAKYGQAIYAWCLRWGASHEDAEDILQLTLLQVFLKVERFERTGRFSFQGWLRQIARNIWLKIVEKNARTHCLEDDQIERLAGLNGLNSFDARKDLLHQFDQIACDEIRRLAFDRVQSRVSEATWNAFLLNDHERMPGREIAEKLGISLGAVRVASFRVRHMLNEELAVIDPAFALPE
jgi:RNA polymerase sigma factor (sigma-70 family)